MRTNRNSCSLGQARLESTAQIIFQEDGLNSTQACMRMYQMHSDRRHNYTKLLSMATLPRSQTGRARLAQVFLQKELRRKASLLFLLSLVNCSTMGGGMGGDGSPGHAVTHLSHPKLHFKRFRKLTLWLSVHTSTAPNMCPVGCCLK